VTARVWTCSCGKTIHGAGIEPHKHHCQDYHANRAMHGMLAAAAELRKAADAIERQARAMALPKRD